VTRFLPSRRQFHRYPHPFARGAGGGDGAVVDAEARVHGLHNLRVVDASIMPAVVNGNLNATVLMMAEKAADMIRGRPPLAPSAAPFYRADPKMQR